MHQIGGWLFFFLIFSICEVKGYASNEKMRIATKPAHSPLHTRFPHTYFFSEDFVGCKGF